MTLSLRAAGLRFAVEGVPILHGVDVELAPGELAAVVGENGAGKTTLVELLAGVRRPTGGEMERRGAVAFVVQRPELSRTLPLTVRDVVAIGTWGRRRSRLAAKRAVAGALERVGMADLARRSIHTLSGGQRQRALIAQGIARDAGILILDEPAAGLDADSRARVRRILVAEASRGKAVLWVTHDEADLAIADSVVRLSRGRRIP